MSSSWVIEHFNDLSTTVGKAPHSLELAEHFDKEDSLAKYRNEFAIPIRRNVSGDSPHNASDLDKPSVYLCGNSLGLMPKRSRELVMQELDVWAARGVEGHWDHPHNRPWAPCDENVKDGLAHLVGAKPSEVTAMNTLTANLHAMMAAFYRPTAERYKIVIEAKAFPSDHYAVTSQIHLHGYDPATALVAITPREGEATLRTEDIIDTIRKDDSIALVLLSGIQYYTGQFFDIEKITKAGHEQGCIVGWDLAHAVGNVPLKLHDWQVDFACWCTYKYVNSGPGNIGGLFVHEGHFQDNDRPRLAGWWGNDKKSRFEMAPVFRPSEGAAGYQMSNPSVINIASLLGSLELFQEATIPKLREKSVNLTGYLEYLLITKLEKHIQAGRFKILTPSNPKERGCQLSLDFPEQMITIFDALHARGVVCDERKPTVIRIAPTPLYNTYTDVYYCVSYLDEILNEIFA
ncbi:hypothetical protein INT45_006997 [Circinella minor]|uniref:Kynureninase n=1 Tax=Circinella minor TaxID=1195481 RepID=A0A8H7S5X2_9FUNG|nr:hypothetical protein INT45_006997 [Circinella minor]